MVDVNDVDALRFVVDAVEQAVRTAAGTEQAGEFAFDGLADAVWLARQVAERELDDGRGNAGRDPLQRASRAFEAVDLLRAERQDRRP